jgi:hypothetical protein
VGACGLGVERVVGVGGVRVCCAGGAEAPEGRRGRRGNVDLGSSMRSKGAAASTSTSLELEPESGEEVVYPRSGAVPVRVIRRASICACSSARTAGRGRRAQREGGRHPARGRVPLLALGGHVSLSAVRVRVPCARQIGGRAADWACAREVHVWPRTQSRCRSTRRRVRRMGMMARNWMWIITQQIG